MECSIPWYGSDQAGKKPAGIGVSLTKSAKGEVWEESALRPDFFSSSRNEPALTLWASDSNPLLKSLEATMELDLATWDHWILCCPILKGAPESRQFRAPWVRTLTLLSIPLRIVFSKLRIVTLLSFLTETSGRSYASKMSVSRRTYSLATRESLIRTPIKETTNNRWGSRGTSPSVRRSGWDAAEMRKSRDDCSSLPRKISR